MGMDVFGKSPSSKEGEYFRRSVWWWHPLSDCCAHFAPELWGKIGSPDTNDGDGLDEEDSIALADRLEALVKDGSIEAYVKARDKKLAALPKEDWSRNYPLTTESVAEFIPFLRACGGFQIC